MPSLSIVIAVKDGESNLPALLKALEPRSHDTEVILCSAGEMPAIAAQQNVIGVARPADTLIPHLWSEGISRARGTAVALTTSQFIPREDWLARLRSADLQQWVGIGGAIESDPSASARNWAIFFLRYSAFAPPLRAGETDEIAADNAVYDRAAIMEHPDLLHQGFWEPSFHRRFRVAGRLLMLNPDLVVIHHGTVCASSFARQRYLHGRAYGTERAGRRTAARNFMLLVSSPLVTPLLLARIISRIARRPAYRAKLLPAFPWLVRFTFAWAVGEAGGYFAALRRTHRASEAGSQKGHA